MADSGAVKGALSNDFYVGYLPLPRSLRGFLAVAVCATAPLVLMSAIVAANSQRDPGTGTWDTRQTKELRGTVRSNPYPRLFTDDRGDGKPGVVLLVESGKRGAQVRTVGLDGSSASVSGYLLNRDGCFMLELLPGEEALHPLPREPGASSVMNSTPSGPTTLRGEIVDSKCFLGAMKPGEGKTHKECAMLCVRGGIPPLLVTRDGAGTSTLYLLANPSQGPVHEAVISHIGEQVEISGQLDDEGGVLVLSVKNIRRL